MTISSSSRVAGPFVGNSVTTVFAFTFKVFAASDLVVERVANATGIETTLVLNTDYTVSLNADQDTSPGGSITLSAALATGYTLAISSLIPRTQEVAIPNAGGFYPEVIESALDRLTIMVQELDERIGTRGLRVSMTSVVSGMSFDVPVVAGAVLQWKADGSGLQSVTLPSLAAYLALPSQAGNSGKTLYTDGANPYWGTVPATVPLSRTITGGGIVTGGGDMNANRVLTVTAATAAEIWAGTAADKAIVPSVLNAAQAFQTLTYGATIAWDTNAQGFNARVTLTGSGATVGAPSNLKDGWIYVLAIKQDATGGRTIGGWNSVFDMGLIGTPVLSTGANKEDYATFLYTNSKLNLISFRKAA